jgi:7-cyano-7-deazaguanine synthase
VKNTREAILISGGIDSTALAYWKRPKLGYVVDYGQLGANAEIIASQKICQILDIDLEVIQIDCKKLGAGSMIGGKESKSSPSPEWWPYRNQLLATLVAPKALNNNISSLIFGSVFTDSFHADGRIEFYQALDNLISLQEGNIRVSAPAIKLNTVELVKVSKIPFEILGWTHSCHVGNFACGLCRGCIKHTGVFRELQSGS